MPMLLAALAACEGARGAEDEPSAHDGVPVVENADGGDRPAWTLGPEPLTDIGGQDESALVLATSAVRTRDGIVVADAGTGELRWFDAAGRPLRTAGRRGGGPGEFQHIGWVGLLPGDSLAAWDPVLRRLSMFDPAGRFARHVSIPARGPLAWVAGVLDGRALIIADRAGVQPSAGEPAWRDTAVLLRVALAGGTADTLGRFAGTEWYSGGGRVMSRPLGRQTAATAGGGTVYVGTAEEYEVRAYGPDGRPRTRIRRPHAPVRVRREDREAYLARTVHVGGSAQDRRARAQALANAPFPQTMPPYTGLLTDARGNLWVRETQPPSATPPVSRWSVFDPRGRWIATVRGPARFRALQAGADWVLGVQPDSSDADHVRIYPLRKR